MRFYLIILTAIVASSCHHSKEVFTSKDQCPFVVDKLTKKDVYPKVDSMPQYPGGNEAMNNFIFVNFNPPKAEKKQTSFEVEYVIDVDGKLIGARIRDKKETEELTPAEKEIIRVFNSMPKWKPGKCNGEIVPVRLESALKIK